MLCVDCLSQTDFEYPILSFVHFFSSYFIHCRLNFLLMSINKKSRYIKSSTRDIDNPSGPLWAYKGRRDAKERRQYGIDVKFPSNSDVSRDLPLTSAMLSSRCDPIGALNFILEAFLRLHVSIIFSSVLSLSLEALLLHGECCRTVREINIIINVHIHTHDIRF